MHDFLLVDPFRISMEIVIAVPMGVRHLDLLVKVPLGIYPRWRQGLGARQRNWLVRRHTIVAAFSRRTVLALVEARGLAVKGVETRLASYHLAGSSGPRRRRAAQAFLLSLVKDSAVNVTAGRGRTATEELGSIVVVDLAPLANDNIVLFDEPAARALRNLAGGCRATTVVAFVFLKSGSAVVIEASTTFADFAVLLEDEAITVPAVAAIPAQVGDGRAGGHGGG